MRTVNQWLSEYGESHQHPTNKTLHWICVPAIFFSIIALFYSVKFPWHINGLQINLALVVLALVTFYYLRLSLPLGIGMLIFGIVCVIFCWLTEKYFPLSLWLTAIIIFIIAWIGQFFGHNIEGKKPSFFKDVQFLLIGPMWLMSFIYKKLGISF